jgi:hypothetical protein
MISAPKRIRHGKRRDGILGEKECVHPEKRREFIANQGQVKLFLAFASKCKLKCLASDEEKPRGKSASVKIRPNYPCQNSVLSIHRFRLLHPICR